MSYLVLARKYRPTQFADVIGQEAIAETLKHALETERVAHAYLFAGQRGVGKTTMARILASALNCAEGPTVTPCGRCDSCQAIARGDDIDVLEIDGASNTGVDNIRDLRSNARYAPARGRYKVYYVDEVHMLSKSAFNALLKTLEEPPPHVLFFFSTTEPHRIPETITSRCQRFDFRTIPPAAIAAQLKRILEAEGLKGSDEVLATLARRARGSLRDALSLLDQLLSATGSADDLTALERLLGLADREQVEALGRAMAAGRPAEGLAIVQQLVDDGRSLGEFLSLLTEHLREALLAAAGGPDSDLAAGATPAAGELARALGANALLYAIQLCAETLRRLPRAGDERLPVELAVIRLCTTDPIVPLADLVERLDRLDRGGGSPGIARPPGGSSGGRGGRPDDAEPRRPPAAGRPGDAGGRGRSGRLFDQAAGPDVEPDTAPEAVAAGRPRGSGDTKWDDTVQAVALERRRVGAMLRHGTILSLDEDSLVLGFPPEMRTFSEQLGEPQTRAFIEAQMRAHFGREIGLQVAILTPNMGEVSGGRAGAAGLAEGALRERALADPAVRSVIDLFDARLVRVSAAERDRPPADSEAVD